MRYLVTFQKIHTQEIEAKDLESAASIACSIVFGQPKDSVKVLSIHTLERTAVSLYVPPEFPPEAA